VYFSTKSWFLKYKSANLLFSFIHNNNILKSYDMFDVIILFKTCTNLYSVPRFWYMGDRMHY